MKHQNKSELLFERAKKVAPGGVHSPVRGFRSVGGVPLFMESAKGAHLKDVDGNSYIDFCMSWGPLLFGHQDPEILEATQAALHRGWSYGTAEPYSLELAELIVSHIPWIEKIRFVNSGTEAVMSALRVARAATQRNLILKFDGCYHGHTDSMLIRSGSGLTDLSTPDSAGVTRATAQETLVCPLNDLETFKKILDERGSEIAVMIVEPLPANYGLLIQSKEFLETTFKLAQSKGILILFDEVISGFRVALGGMAEILGLKPDLVTYGKVIGGGFPVGAFGGKRELLDLVAPLGAVYQAGTLSANPVAMSAGLAMLRKIIKTSPYGALKIKTETFVRQANSLLKENSKYPAHFVSFESLFWPILGEVKSKDGFVRSPTEIPAQQKERFSKIFHSMASRGIYFAPSGYEVGFVSTAHTTAHFEAVLEALDQTLKE
jgi:glutamate-1-semialdehyde 2,1-aminomutase